MNSVIVTSTLLRLLPAVAFLLLGFLAGADKSTRERWSELLYQIGSIKPEQRSDPKIQRGARLPFFIVGILLLAWPVNHFIHANQKVEVTAESDLKKSSAAPSSDLGGAKPAPVDSNAATANAATGNAATTNAVSGAAPAAVATTAPAAPATVATTAPAPAAPAPGGGVVASPHL